MENSIRAPSSKNNGSAANPQLRVVENTTFRGDIFSYAQKMYFGNQNWGMNSYENAYPTNIVEGSFTMGLTDKKDRRLYLVTYGIIVFRGAINVPTSITVGNGSNQTGTLVLDTDNCKVNDFVFRTGDLLCKRENVLNGARIGLSTQSSDIHGSSLDFGGFNQTVSEFYVGESYSSTAGDGHEIKSPEGPVTLTVTGLPSKVSCDCYFAINDNVSLLLDAHPGYTCNFIKRENGTAGEIIVSNGTFAVTGTATFKNVPKITVAKNGVFDLLSSKENALAGVRNLEIAGVFRSSSKNPFGDGNMAIALEKGALLDAGTKIEVASLSIDGETLEVGVYAHDKYEEIAKGTAVVVVPAAARTSAVWTGGGADANIATALNWEGGVCPSLSDGSSMCTFAAGGELAYIDRLVKFHSLKFAGNGFSLQKASSESNAGIEVFGPSISFEPVDGNPERTFDIDVPVVVAEKQYWGISSNTTVKLKDAFYALQNAHKGGIGNLEFSGTNVFDRALVITNGTTRFSGTITTSSGVDGSAYSANNAILCYNSANEGLYGKVILDNAIIEKPFCAIAPRQSESSKQFLVTTENSSNVIRGVWMTRQRIWQTLRQDATSTVVFEGGISNTVHTRLLGGTVYIRNKPHFFTYDGGNNGDKGFVLGDSVDVFYEAAGGYLRLFNPGVCTVNYMVSYAITGGYAYNSSSATVFNLNATTQRFDRVTLVSGMKISGNEGSAIEVAGSKESRIAATVNGDVSFLNYGAGTLTFEGSGFASTGEIVATNGTVVIAEGAQMGNLACAIATGSGVIQIGNTASQAFGKTTDVYLSEDGKISVQDGTVQRVRYLYIDGVRMPVGNYSYANTADENVKKHFAETAGVLRCIGDPGMSIVIR